MSEIEQKPTRLIKVNSIDEMMRIVPPASDLQVSGIPSEMREKLIEIWRSDEGKHSEQLEALKKP